MEVAGLYAFAQARHKPVVCFALVTNQMARMAMISRRERTMEPSMPWPSPSADGAAAWRAHPGSAAHRRQRDGGEP